MPPSAAFSCTAAPRLQAAVVNKGWLELWPGLYPFLAMEDQDSWGINHRKENQKPHKSTALKEAHQVSLHGVIHFPQDLLPLNIHNRTCLLFYLIVDLWTWLWWINQHKFSGTYYMLDLLLRNSLIKTPFPIHKLNKPHLAILIPCTSVS